MVSIPADKGPTNQEPMFIPDRGRPAHVSLSIEAYPR